jgi:hypothetical protein
LVTKRQKLALVRSSATAFGLVAQPQNTLPFETRAFEALARLPHLHDEAGRTLWLAQFLGRSPQACIVLLIAGAVLVLLSPNGLKAEFTWAVMLLIGVMAIIRNYIRGFASGTPHLPLEGAVAHLRGLLLYAGLVWGSGAFLMLPGQPAPILTFAFAVVPAAALALTLKDGMGVPAFAAPAAVATVTAALLAGWPQAFWVSAAILAALPGIIVIPALQQKPLHLGGPALR